MPRPQIRTPERPRHHTIPRYAAAVTAHATARLNQKPTPERSSVGSITNKTREGRMSHKILCDRSATRWALPVSRYSQTNARSEVSGSEAMAAPQKVLRFAISDTATTTAAVMRVLTTYCNIMGFPDFPDTEVRCMEHTETMRARGSFER
jgi:hypothetical protein